MIEMGITNNNKQTRKRASDARHTIKLYRGWDYAGPAALYARIPVSASNAAKSASLRNLNLPGFTIINTTVASGKNITKNYNRVLQ